MKILSIIVGIILFHCNADWIQNKLPEDIVIGDTGMACSPVIKSKIDLKFIYDVINNNSYCNLFVIKDTISLSNEPLAETIN